MQKRHLALLMLTFFLFPCALLGCNRQSADSSEAKETTKAAVDYFIPENIAISEKILSMATIESTLFLGGKYGDMHEKIASSNGQNLPEYRIFCNVLKQIKDETGASYVYTLVKIDDSTVELVGNAAEGDGIAVFGTKYPIEPQYVSAFSGVPSYALYTRKDPEYGILKSAFAPISNSRGEVIAIMGIDYPVPELSGHPELIKE